MISLNQMKSTSVKQAADFPMPPDSEIRIVLVDDNELRRAGLKSLISTTEDFTVVGEAKDKTQAIDLIRRERPHIILLNIEIRCGG
jgi:CheY-like chemotaxis protein